jgi:hypothetical protein
MDVCAFVLDSLVLKTQGSAAHTWNAPLATREVFARHE